MLQKTEINGRSIQIRNRVPYSIGDKHVVCVIDEMANNDITIGVTLPVFQKETLEKFLAISLKNNGFISEEYLKLRMDIRKNPLDVERYLRCDLENSVFISELELVAIPNTSCFYLVGKVPEAHMKANNFICFKPRLLIKPVTITKKEKTFIYDIVTFDILYELY